MDGKDVPGGANNSATSGNRPISPAWLGRMPQRPDPIKEFVEWVKSMLWSAGFVSFILMLLLSFIIVMAMTPEIQQWITTPQPIGNDQATLVLPLDAIFIITPWPIYLFILQGVIFQAWHLLLLGILFSAFAYAKFDLLSSWLSKKGGALRSLRKPREATSSLEAVAKLFMACMFFSIVYFLFLDLITVQMKSPDFSTMPRAELIYRLFSASVFEELISRVLLIGVPLAIIGLLKGWGRAERSILGGGMGLNLTTLILIIFSATVFAFAHVGSWDLWKVPQVLIPGFALGWAFVRYGLHASILIHFSINLSTSAFEIWPNNLALTMLFGIAILIWIVAGGYFFLHYCIEFAMSISPKRLREKMVRSRQKQTRGKKIPRRIRVQRTCMREFMRTFHARHNIRRRKRRTAVWFSRDSDAVSAPRAVEPPQARAHATPEAANKQQHEGFICPKCGNITASYDAGTLTCLKCGTTHHKNQKVDDAPKKEQIEF